MDTHWEGQDADLTRVSARSDQSRYLKEKTASWYQKVFDRGWALVNWPENSGGVGWDSTQKYIWMSECARRCISFSFAYAGGGACWSYSSRLGKQ